MLGTAFVDEDGIERRASMGKAAAAVEQGACARPGLFRGLRGMARAATDDDQVAMFHGLSRASDNA